MARKAPRLPRLLGLTPPTLSITMSPLDATSITDIRTLSIIIADKFDKVLRLPTFSIFTDITFQTQDCIFCNSQANICVDCQVTRQEEEMKQSQKSAKSMEYLDLNGVSPQLQNSLSNPPFKIVSSTTNSLPWKLNDDVVIAKIKKLRNSTFMYQLFCSSFLIVSQRTFTTPISHSPVSQTTPKHNIDKSLLPANAIEGRRGPAVFGGTGSSKQVMFFFLEKLQRLILRDGRLPPSSVTTSTCTNFQLDPAKKTVYNQSMTLVLINV